MVKTCFALSSFLFLFSLDIMGRILKPRKSNWIKAEGWSNVVSTISSKENYWLVIPQIWWPEIWLTDWQSNRGFFFLQWLKGWAMWQVRICILIFSWWCWCYFLDFLYMYMIFVHILITVHLFSVILISIRSGAYVYTHTYIIHNTYIHTIYI